ncbi:hypothetical protein RM530_00745 [Algiphilus sp. W345]|uniref:Uncharacterized protein n=1 Tax=Banduia mediterranea TaxID=3075609 RepID=A0ABU2WF19_9GAMM|nr:hypothetical protein [Algiphilus sp. W345]MDT0495894.1 hypothetical protein [Algiphilus sp. W345]
MASRFKYQDDGIITGLDNVRVLEIRPFNQMGTPMQLIRPFGSKTGFEQAVHDLQDALYRDTRLSGPDAAAS